MFWAEWTVGHQPVDQRDVLLKQDLKQLNEAENGGIDFLSIPLKDRIDTFLNNQPELQSCSVFTRSNQEQLLILVKIRDFQKIKVESRRVLIEAIEDYVKSLQEYRDKQLYIGIKGLVLLGAIKTPERERIKPPVPENYLYPFYAPEPIIQEIKETNGKLI